MNKTEHLLTIVGEECSEVHQRCSKALRFGMNEIEPNQAFSNQRRILQEFNDLVAVMEMLFECPINKLLYQHEIMAKKDKVLKFLEYSKEQGTLL
jgi:hypothetical protein